MANPILGWGGPGRAVCGHQHRGCCGARFAPGLHGEQQLGRCLAHPESIASLSHRLLHQHPSCHCSEKCWRGPSHLFFLCGLVFTWQPRGVSGVPNSLPKAWAGGKAVSKLWRQIQSTFLGGKGPGRCQGEQLQPKVGPELCARAPISALLSSSTGIGVGLVGFGLFFILFGMLLYFDSVLLAFGNVSMVGLGLPAAGTDAKDRAKGPSGQGFSDLLPFTLPDPLPLRLGLHHRLQEDLHLLLPAAKAEGHQLLPWGGPHCPHAVAPPGHAAGGLWLHQPLQVRPAAPSSPVWHGCPGLESRRRVSLVPCSPRQSPRCSHPGKITAWGLTETFILI